MNTILQKRIEEAVKKICCTDCPFESIRNCKECVEKENAIKTATFALQNQWIPVSEALPKESGDYLVIVKQSSDSEAYFHEISTYNATDNIWFYVGKLIVTHWASIPIFEGGEK